MNEKFENLRKVLELVGFVALTVYLGLCLGKANIFWTMRVYAATIALAAFSIEYGIEIAIDKKSKTTVAMIVFSLIDIFASAVVFAFL